MYYRVQERGSGLRSHNGCLLCVRSIEDVMVVVRGWYGDNCDLYEVEGVPAQEYEEEYELPDGSITRIRSVLVKPSRVRRVGAVNWNAKMRDFEVKMAQKSSTPRGGKQIC